MIRFLSAVVLAFVTSWTAPSQTYTISTFAGNGLGGFTGDNGLATSAELSGAPSVAVDLVGNVYIADAYNNCIRKVSAGLITTIAGNGTPGFDGDNFSALGAELFRPYGVAVSAGDVYIADTFNNRIRKVSNGVITTVAGIGSPGFSGDNGPATSAQLNYPSFIAVDSIGNLYVADTNNNRVRKIANGVITTIAGNGTRGFSGDKGSPLTAELNTPYGVAVDSVGNFYIADWGNSRIRMVSNGVITTLAGNGTTGFSGDNGPAISAELSNLWGVTVDSIGGVYIADTNNNRIRKVSSSGVIITLAGTGTMGFNGDNGPATSARLNAPFGIAVDSAGDLYIADYGNFRIRLLTPNGTPIITPGGVVPVYSVISVVQPGSWVSIFGSNLASGNFVWSGDFPTSLGGTNVTIDNKPAYLWFAGPTQINLQIPDDSSAGVVTVAVNAPSGTATSTVTLAAYGPSFSLLGDGKHVAGEIATPNGTGGYGGGTYDLVGPSGGFSFNTRPVKAGETLILYGVGFGPTTPQVPSGQIFSGAAPTNTPVTITIGGVVADVEFAGITEAGLYQFNLIVPQNTGTGDQALQATVNGVQTAVGPVVTAQ